MPHKAKLIPPDGIVSEILLPDDDAERLAMLQNLVGGLLDVKPLANDLVMVMALPETVEEKNLPANDFATSLAFRARAIYADEDVFGTVVVVHSDLV